MSGWTPEENVEAKNKRRGVIEQKPGKGKSKKDRPIKVEYKSEADCVVSRILRKKWWFLGNYADMKAAQMAIDKKRRQRPDTEFRITDRREE